MFVYNVTMHAWLLISWEKYSCSILVHLQSTNSTSISISLIDTVWFGKITCAKMLTAETNKSSKLLISRYWSLFIGLLCRLVLFMLHMPNMQLAFHVFGVLSATQEATCRRRRNRVVHVLALHVRVGEFIPLQLAQHVPRIVNTAPVWCLCALRSEWCRFARGNNGQWSRFCVWLHLKYFHARRSKHIRHGNRLWPTVINVQIQWIF